MAPQQPWLPVSRPSDITVNPAIRCTASATMPLSTTGAPTRITLGPAVLSEGSEFRGVLILNASSSENKVWAWFGTADLAAAKASPATVGLVAVPPGTMIPLQSRGRTSDIDLTKLNLQCDDGEFASDVYTYML